MTDTNQLPEPELGYIKTDKSNPPAFSARQMREMKDTNQLPGAPQIQQLGWVYCYQGQEPAFSYTPQPTGIPKTHYWQVPVFDTEQARAQVQGEPVYWEWRHLSTHPNTVDFGQWSEWQRVEARNAIHTIEGALAEFRTYIAQGYKYELRALYTAPQPAQVTQTDVTDEQILEIAEPFGEFQYGDAQGHKRIDFARAIIALRPERVPMTEWQPIETAPKDGPFLAVLDCGGDQTICTMRYAVAEAKNNRPSGEFIRERVTHWMPLPALPESPCNGIIAQAKKEDV